MDSSSKGFSFPPFLSLQIQNITSKFPLPLQLCHLNPNNILLHSSFGIQAVLAGEEMFSVMNVNCSTNCLSGIFFFFFAFVVRRVEVFFFISNGVVWVRNWDEAQFLFCCFGWDKMKLNFKKFLSLGFVFRRKFEKESLCLNCVGLFLNV